MSERNDKKNTIIALSMICFFCIIVIFAVIGNINSDKKKMTPLYQTTDETKSQGLDEETTEEHRTKLGFLNENSTNEEKVENINRIFSTMDKIYLTTLLISDNKYSPPKIKQYSTYLVFEKGIVKLMNTNEQLIDSFRISSYQEGATLVGNHIFNMVLINKNGKHCKASLSIGSLSRDQLSQLTTDEMKLHLELSSLQTPVSPALFQRMANGLLFTFSLYITFDNQIILSISHWS